MIPAVNNSKTPLSQGEIKKTEIPEKIKSVIKSVVDYLQTNNQILEGSHHVYRKTSGLSVPFNIDGNGVFFPLGITLGKGAFRETKLAFAISKITSPIVALSKQEITTVREKALADKEEAILQKIAQYLKKNPDERGVLKFFTSFNYVSHRKKEKQLNPKLSDYDENLDVHKNSSNNNNSSVIDKAFGKITLTPKKKAKQISYDDVVIDTSKKVFKKDELSGQTQKSPQKSKNDSCISQTNLNQLEKRVKKVLITDFCNGETLKNKLGFLNDNEKCMIAEDLLRGLSILHKLKIFHSDLKADNIFLKMNKNHDIIQAVIGDFGFACDLSDPEDCFYKNGHVDTRSPELLTMKIYTPIDEIILSSDVYAVGLILNQVFADDFTKANSSKNKINYFELKALIDQMLSEKALNRPSPSEALKKFIEIFSL